MSEMNIDQDLKIDGEVTINDFNVFINPEGDDGTTNLYLGGTTGGSALRISHTRNSFVSIPIETHISGPRLSIGNVSFSSPQFVGGSPTYVIDNFGVEGAIVPNISVFLDDDSWVELEKTPYRGTALIMINGEDEDFPAFTCIINKRNENSGLINLNTLLDITSTLGVRIEIRWEENSRIEVRKDNAVDNSGGYKVAIIYI